MAERFPNRQLERKFAREHGVFRVAGVDEAGRGPLAGPVFSAAVILPKTWRQPALLNDSKKLTESQRETLYDQIITSAVSFGVASASPEEIDELNILSATKLAACRAIDQLNPGAQCLVTDYLTIKEVQLPQLPLVKGDAKCSSVAAASILAKVSRDRYMTRLAEICPQYGWEKNKGYGTKEHLNALEKFGPSAYHRFTFRGIGFFHKARPTSPLFEELRRDLKVTGNDKELILALEARVKTALPFLSKHEGMFLLKVWNESVNSAS